MLLVQILIYQYEGNRTHSSWTVRKPDWSKSKYLYLHFPIRIFIVFKDTSEHRHIGISVNHFVEIDLVWDHYQLKSIIYSFFTMINAFHSVGIWKDNRIRFQVAVRSIPAIDRPAQYYTNWKYWLVVYSWWNFSFQLIQWILLLKKVTSGLISTQMRCYIGLYLLNFVVGVDFTLNSFLVHEV